MKLFYKFLVATLFISVVSAGVSTLWGVLFVKREYENRVKNMLSSAADNIADAVGRYLSSSTQSVYITFRRYKNLDEMRKLAVFSEIMRSFGNILFLSDGEVSAGDVKFGKAPGKGIFEYNGAFVFSGDSVTIAVSEEPVREIIASFSIGHKGKIFISSNQFQGVSGLQTKDEELVAFRKIPGTENLYAVVSVPADELSHVWRKILNQIIFFSLFGVALSFVISFVVSRGITKPLYEVEKLSEKYAKLDFSERIKTARRDEIGKVIRAFSVMADEIEKAWEELKKWNEELERRVEERTAQLKKMHENLLVAEKMAAVGTLGAGVAHEINNPLAASLGFLQIVSRKIQEENLKKYLDRAIPNLRRIREIVSRVSYFAEVQMKAEYDRCDIIASIKSAIDEIEDDIKKEKKIIFRADEQHITIYADEEQLKVAFYEILKNAFLASRSKVSVEVKMDKNKIFIHVSDDGEKVPDEIRKRIFDPFFTLKKWEGVGLGLTIAKTIFMNIRGDAYLQEDGKTFTIEIDTEKNREIKEFLKEEEEMIKAHLV